MSSEAVKVVVRIRPLNTQEKEQNQRQICNADSDTALTHHHPSNPSNDKNFSYDQIFDEKSTQIKVFEETTFPLVEAVISGYNATVFAYGQTGCGKTFTMIGQKNDEQLKGVIPRAFETFFQSINIEKKNKQFLVRCSYCEIYKENIRDLLSSNPKNKLELKENKDKVVYIKNLNMQIVNNLQDIASFLQSGDKNRTTGETAMNERSSRSHAIFTVYLEMAEQINGKQKIVAGKLNLVDLAGSERQSKTNAEGERLQEANKINLSLSALGNVISALVDGKSQHVPYRDSKLTRLLQDSLGGNTKTVMIAVVSPAESNYDETLSTLRYASRAKFIQNKPRINEDPKDTLIKQYQNEIEMLKAMLQQSMNSKQISINQSQIKESFRLQQNEENDDEGDLREEKNRFLRQLSIKNNEVQSEIQEKQRLEKILSELQQKMVQGGEQPQNEEEVREKRQMIKKIKKQKMKQKKIIEEQKKQQEEQLFLEQKYQSSQQEVESQRELIKNLRQKLQSTINEIEELQHQGEFQKQEL